MRLAFFQLAEDIQTEVSDIFLPAPLQMFNAKAREEYWATLSLRHTPGVGARSIAKLLKGFGSALEACHNLSQWPEFGVAKTKAAEYAKEAWRGPAKKEWLLALKNPAKILLWQSPDYPRRLREIADAPALLYGEGNLDLLKGACLGIVGTRNPSRQGVLVAGSLARGLSGAGVTVVSGMAMGIDRIAHQAALENIGGSIGVLGTGIDLVYPRSNADIFARMRENGLLLSEFSPGQAPAAANFPIRNRIISGLSLGIVVVEAAVRSGSLVTARLALEQNREVFAVPGEAFNAQSQGCQNLVRQGARPVFSTEDILRDLMETLKTFGLSPEIAAAKERAPSGENPKQRHLSKTAPLTQICQGRELAKLAGSRVSVDESLDELADNPLAGPVDEPQNILAVEQAARSLLEGDSASVVLAALRKAGPMCMDQLTMITNLSVAELMPVVLGLEITGEITRLAGGRYESS